MIKPGHISVRINMARDKNPSSPGEDGAWFKVRKNGRYINIPSELAVSGNPKLAWFPLEGFTSMPTADALIVFAINSNDEYHVYLDESSEWPMT